MGYIFVVIVAAIVSITVFHPPTSPHIDTIEELCATSLFTDSSSNDLPRGKFFLKLQELNHSLSLKSRINTVWIQERVSERIDHTSKEEGNEHNESEKIGQKSSEYQSKKSSIDLNNSNESERQEETNETEDSTSSSADRYGVAFWLHQEEEGTEEGNHTGYKWKDELSRLLEGIGAQAGDPVFLRIFKEEKELEVWMEVAGRFELLERFKLCYISGELGPKTYSEDGQFPEGFYQINSLERPLSPLPYRYFELSYPNSYDRYYDRTGERVKIIGSCVGNEGVGVSSEVMEILHTLVREAFSRGETIVPVHSFPFHLSIETLRNHLGEEWYLFWENLKQGYDLFNRTRHIPQVFVEEGEYTFRLQL
ncbi:MAG: hypothetical protein GXO39_08825 [Thermotogae bacterium]|nr:hypothetical protein [Thermotogota bacterium]